MKQVSRLERISAILLAVLLAGSAGIASVLYQPLRHLIHNTSLLQAPWIIQPAYAQSTVTHQETRTGTATSGTTVTTSASLTGAANNLYIAAISVNTNGTARNVTNVTGLGLTWTVIKEQCSTSSTTESRTEVWYAIGTAPTTGAVTATYSSSGAAAIAVSRYSGVDPVSPIGASVAANIAGVNGSCAGGPSATSSYTVNITTTAANSKVFGAAGTRHRGTTHVKSSSATVTLAHRHQTTKILTIAIDGVSGQVNVQ